MTATRGAVFLASLLLAACGGRGGVPPGKPPVVVGPDGQKYYLLEKGPYKAFYDHWGRLLRIEYDSNQDGKPDHIAHHEGGKVPKLIEIDEDFDGGTDRWEYYDEQGVLQKVGTARKGSAPDAWTYPDGRGGAARIEYDDDDDGRTERTEWLRDGVLHRVDLDADRDGRPDRWQVWEQGRLVSEELDTDGDGKADRRIRYGAQGQVEAFGPIGP